MNAFSITVNPSIIYRVIFSKLLKIFHTSSVLISSDYSNSVKTLLKYYVKSNSNPFDYGSN